MATKTLYLDQQSKDNVDSATFTIKTATINSYVATNIPNYSIINSMIFNFTAYKGASVFSADLTVSVAGTEIINKKKGCEYNWGDGISYSPNIVDYCYSDHKYAGQIKGEIVIYMVEENSLDTNHHYAAKNMSIEWTYTPPTYKISLTQITGGTIAQSGNGTYNVDSSVTLTATPSSGYRFVRWSDGNTNASRVLTVTTNDISSNVTNLTYSAVFEKIPYTLTVNVNDTSMANIEMYRNGVIVSGNSIDYSVNDIANFKVYANKGYILSSFSVSNNTSSSITTVPADEAHNESYLDDTYMVFTWNDMVISESMLGMEVTINFEFIAGSKIYTLTITANDNDLGDIILYKNDTKVEGNIFEGVTGDKFIITATANDDSFVYSVSDETTILDKNTLISTTFLDDTCKRLNLPIEVKESYIGNEETFTINFTPGVNMYFAGKKAIELYYEGNLFSGAYFEGNKL